MSGPPDDDSPPMNYRNGRDDVPEVWEGILSSTGGFVGGAVAFLALGFVGFIVRSPPMFNEAGPPPEPWRYWPETVAFGVVAAASLGAFVVLVGRRPRRFLLLGFLLGVIITSLVEGTCFFNPRM